MADNGGLGGLGGLPVGDQPVYSQDQSQSILNYLLGKLKGVGNGLYDAATLPGDVYAGRQLLNDPETGRTSDEAIGRAFNLAGMATGAAAPAEGGTVNIGIRAYHGSPHDFDAFDLSKIGTGEGAQAYGHGLYFAEAPEVAEGYKQALSRRNIDVKLDGEKIQNWPQTVDALNKDDWRLGKLVDEYGRVGGPVENFIQQQRDWYRGDKPMEAALEQFTNRIDASHTPGKMYEVNINADPEHFLDWDKPLSEQSPKVQEALTPQGLGLKPGGPDGPFNGRRAWVDDTGLPLGPVTTAKEPPTAVFDPRDIAASVYRQVGRDNPALSTERLKAAGIPGIKYLDAGSRAAGDGSRNYVVFDPKMIEIMRKYGLAGLIGAGGLGGLGGYSGQPDQSATSQ